MTRDARTRRRRPGAPESEAPQPARSPVALRLYRRGRPPGSIALEPGASISIGRGAQADLCFDDENVSRLHAHVKHEQGAWVLVDARSANGTFVLEDSARETGNLSVDAERRAAFASARVIAPGQPHTLSAGDVVFFGDASAALEALAEQDANTNFSSTAPQSAAGQRFSRELERAARARGPVLLIGPSGSGKTWAARRVHDASGRSGRFVTLNAAALPLDPVQLRSVLLGHKKGAFTGAIQDADGAWSAAHGGTLFLDEVDSLAPPGQAFLLTLLEQSGDLGALGDVSGGRTAPLDVRVITASKTSLQQAQLRPDLAFRLVDGSIVEIPSLHDRRADIPGIVAALLDELAREDGAAASFDEDALSTCVELAWPGHVRQLRSVVRVLAREALAEGRSVVTAVEVRTRADTLSRALGGALPAAPSAGREHGEKKKARALTEDDVKAALDGEGGNIQRAAERLGVARNTLVSKMDGYGIARPGRGRQGTDDE